MQNETLKSILSVVGDYQQRGSEYVCKCPAHDDHSPSLWLTESGDKVLWICRSGCSQDQVFAALKARGVTFGPRGGESWRVSLPKGIPYLYPTRSMLARNGKAPDADNQKMYRDHYPYHDATGNIIGHVVRYQRDNKKDLIPFFKQWHDNSWRSGHSVLVNRPLYNLHLIAAPTSANKVIYIVEGEKCANAFNKAYSGYVPGGPGLGGDGVFAITWPGGSKSVKKADWSVLKGRLVVIWCDYDAAGLSAGRSLRSCLAGIVAGLSFVDIGSLGFTSEGSDVVDWLAGKSETPPPPLGSLQDVPDLSFGPSPSPDLQSPSPAVSALNFGFPLTEFGNVQRFMAAHKSQVVHTPENGWFSWSGSRWVKDDSKLICKLVADTLRAIPDEIKRDTPNREAEAIRRWATTCQKNSAVNNVVSLLTSEQSLNFSFAKFDSDPMLLNCPNGTVDLRTGSLRKHSQHDYAVHQTAVGYNPAARCPTWLNFMDYAFEGKLDIIEYFQRAVGYCVTGDTSEQVFFATEGPGASGKGVAFETLAYVLGSYANSIKAETFLLDYKGSAATGDNSIAAIRGARLCLSSEINAGARLNEARVKELTGQDTIQARFLYKEFFNFTPVAKFWLRCNGLPHIQGGDSGIWRRIRLLPFKRAVTKADMDRRLRDKLKLEADGILAWCVDGCLKWQRLSLSPPEVCNMEAMKYREDMDLVGLWLSERCVFDDNAKTKSTTLYESYLEWCEVQGETPKSQRWLAFELRSRGLARVRVSSGSLYSGVRLKNDGMAQEKLDSWI